MNKTIISAKTAVGNRTDNKTFRSCTRRFCLLCFTACAIIMKRMQSCRFSYHQNHGGAAMSGMEKQCQTKETLNHDTGFWVNSWKHVDPERITEYMHTFDMGADEIIAALHRHGVQSVCDAGCGCGIYALKLAANGFAVSGFDVSANAVELAQALLGRTAHRLSSKRPASWRLDMRMASSIASSPVMYWITSARRMPFKRSRNSAGSQSPAGSLFSHWILWMKSTKPKRIL